MDSSSMGAWASLLYPLNVIAVALDAFFPPLPAEVMVVTSGSLCADNRLLLPLALLAAALGCVLGDLAVYGLFRRRLTHLLDRFGWGRRVHRGIRTAVARGGRSSTLAAIVAGRFIPAGRTATMAAAGIADVPLRRVLRGVILGAVLWSVWMVGLGYVTGRTMGLPLWANTLIGMAVGILVGLVAATVFGARRRLADSRARAALDTDS
jgi:membrane protein DedA with SNARE-associated domain